MPTVSPDDPRLKGARPLWGLAILVLPIVGVVLTILAYAGMVSLGLVGRPATGDRVELAFRGCPEARPLVEARVGDMGLQASWRDAPDGWVGEVVLPADPAVAAAIPATLATPGALEVRGDDAVLATNADVVDASVRLDVMMTAYTLLHLRPESAERVKDHVRRVPDGRLDFWLDGERIGGQANSDPMPVGEVEIAPPIANENDRLRAVAAWSVIVDHGPLPCPVEVAAPVVVP